VNRMKENTLKTVRIVLLAAAVVMIAAGILWGEALTVFRKAVIICLECIGIG
jgi:hypothetical protein